MVSTALSIGDAGARGRELFKDRNAEFSHDVDRDNASKARPRSTSMASIRSRAYRREMWAPSEAWQYDFHRSAREFRSRSTTAAYPQPSSFVLQHFFTVLDAAMSPWLA